MTIIAGIRPWFHLGRFEGEENPPPAPTGDPPPAPAPTPTGDPSKADPPDPAKTFTQAEIDKIVSDRLKRQAAQYAGHDELKKKAEEYDKLQEAQKTELQKVQDRAEAAEKKAAESEERANRALIRAAVVAEATKAKAIAPEDVLAVLAPDSVKIGDDGKPTGVAEAVKAALDARPHWVDDGRPHGSGDGGHREGGPVGDFRTADKNTLAAELAKHGLQPRSW